MQKTFLAGCPEWLADICLFMLETGVRRKEMVTLLKTDVHLDPIGTAKRGYARVRGTKSATSQRNVPLTEEAQSALVRAMKRSKSEYVFVSPDDSKTALSKFTFGHAVADVRDRLKLPKTLVGHSFRHTLATRLGESGAEATAIMHILGHSTLAISQRYTHPSAPAMERAMDQLEGLGQIKDGGQAAVNGAATKLEKEARFLDNLPSFTPHRRAARRRLPTRCGIGLPTIVPTPEHGKVIEFQK